MGVVQRAVLQRLLVDMYREAKETNDGHLHCIATTLEFTGPSAVEIYQVFAAAVTELARRNRELQKMYIELSMCTTRPNFIPKEPPCPP